MAVIDIKQATIRLVDGSEPIPKTMSIKVGEGNLTYGETRNREYILDRGVIDSVRDGDQAPLDLSFDLMWEEISASVGLAVPTAEDALKKRGDAATWVTSDTDACQPYCVDVEMELDAGCVDEDGVPVKDREIIIFPQFRYESLSHDLRAGTIAASGMCNVLEAKIEHATAEALAAAFVAANSEFLSASDVAAMGLTTDFSLVTWIRASTLSGRQGLITKWDTTAPVAATGSITVVDGASLVDGDDFTLDDGVNPALNFEFDNDASIAGDVAITFTGAETATQIRDLVISAINGATIDITASPGGADVVTLTADTPGALANQTILEAVADAGFLVSGMSSGANMNAEWALYLEDARVRFEIQATSNGGDALGTTYIESNVSLVVDTWYLVSVVYDGSGVGNSGRLQLWIDDAQEASATYTGTIPAAILNRTAQLRFGAFVTTASYYTGRIGMTGLWGKQVTSGEIASFHKSGLGKVYVELSSSEKTSLVAYWNMGQASGSRADSHSNAITLADNASVLSASGVRKLSSTGVQV